MANRTRTPTPRRKHLSPSPPPTRIRKPGWAASLLATVVLLSGAGLVTGGVWLSIQLMVNPDAASWVNQFLPKWVQIPLVNREPPQTLKQIRAKITQRGLIPGVPLPLETTPLQAKSLLLPVLSARSYCRINCQQIVELRVYHSAMSADGEPYYQLLSQVPVEGPDESFVLAPLVDPDAPNQGSTRSLPLAELHRFEGSTPKPGHWFYLQGQRVQGNAKIAYGYIVHYNPSRSYLSLMLPWTSPTGQPQWQEVTDGGSPELVIDQTVDMEPQLRVYQVKSLDFFLNPRQLAPISLTEPALSEPAYQDALVVARSGLWSPAWKWLQFIKQQRQGRMPASAQAQIDLIGLHAQIAQIQAKKTWASPSQQVLAELIDGQWGEGLRVFQASAGDSSSPLQDIATLLRTDTGRLWNRVETALQVNPNRPEVLAWGALLRCAKHGQKSAIAWLKAQPQNTPATLAYIQPFLDQLDGKFSTPGRNSTRHPSRIVGSVAVTPVNPAEWLQPHQKTVLKLDNQHWYQIQVAAFHDGKRWQRTPFLDLRLPKPKSAAKTEKVVPPPIPPLWHLLGLDTNSQIQIIVWLPDGQQQTNLAVVKAVQLKNGVLRLLATSSEPIPEAKDTIWQPKPLAVTEAALQWVQPAPITLSELNQQQPSHLTAILPALWQELQKSGQLSTSTPSIEQMRQQLGDWPVQVIDLTGDASPELVLTVSSEAITLLNNSESGEEVVNNPAQTRTLIFSDTGKLIYSEFSSDNRTVRALADLEDGKSPSLLVERTRNYSLERWNVKQQRFE